MGWHAALAHWPIGHTWTRRCARPCSPPLLAWGCTAFQRQSLDGRCSLPAMPSNKLSKARNNSWWLPSSVCAVANKTLECGSSPCQMSVCSVQASDVNPQFIMGDSDVAFPALHQGSDLQEVDFGGGPTVEQAHGPHGSVRKKQQF